MENTDDNPLAPLSTPSPGNYTRYPSYTRLDYGNYGRQNIGTPKYPLTRGIIPDTHRTRGWNMEITVDNPLAPLSTPSPGELYPIPIVHEAGTWKLRTTIHWSP